MGITPCKECRQRYPACHDKCLSYIDWKQKNQVIKDRIFKEKEAIRGVRDSNLNRMRSFGEKH